MCVCGGGDFRTAVHKKWVGGWGGGGASGLLYTRKGGGEGCEYTRNGAGRAVNTQEMGAGRAALHKKGGRGGL